MHSPFDSLYLYVNGSIHGYPARRVGTGGGLILDPSTFSPGIAWIHVQLHLDGSNDEGMSMNE